MNKLSLTPYSQFLTSRSHLRAFTLVEVMITVAIITILASVGTYSWREVSRHAQANIIASDFKKMEGAWQLWRTDSHLAYPNESIFDSESNPSGANRVDENNLQYCNEESFIGETAIFDNTIPGITNANWQGPYLNQEIRDPWGRHYMYDNDGNQYNNDCASLGAGTNIQLSFCPEVHPQYDHIAQLIDTAIDNTTSGGACIGKFRWTTNAPHYFLYLLDSNQ